jgi:iron complex outermembrane receptor protein
MNINMCLKKFNITALLLSTSVCTTYLSAEQINVLNSITSTMDRFGDIATKTKQNEHYQPYIISVFKGKELERLGVSNLKEALSLVPGADIATNNFNNQIPIFRGSNPLACGQSKLFIDDVLVNNLFFDDYSIYLSMPIEMIKRIEVVRGPGSKTDGINAYAGSINVITYTEDIEGFEENDKIVLKGGSYDYKMGGFVKTYKEGNFRLFTDFFYQDDNKKLHSGPDALAQGAFSFGGVDNTGLSKSGDAPLWLKNYSLGLTLKYKDFSLKARTYDHTQGSAYGYLNMLPEDDGRLKQPNHYLELGYSKKINDIAIDIKMGAKYGTFDNKAKVSPDMFELAPGIVFNDGMHGEYYAKQRTLYQSTFVKYSGLQHHTFTVGYKLTREETIDMVYKFSNLTTGDAALVDYTETRPFFDKDAKRQTYNFFFQDEFHYSDRLNFIYGFNYEETSLEDSGLDPRVSLVYQPDTKNIFKVMYSKSHRNPSWQEMFSINNHVLQANTNLKPESVNAFEAAYIRKISSDSHLQANFFYLLNKKQIYNTSAHPDYSNTKDTDIYGMELEYKGSITSDDQLYLNYSYVDGKNNNESYLANVAHHMLKGYYIYNLSNTFSLSTVAKYVGSKKRESEETREKLGDYSTFDASLHYENRTYDYSLTLSAKNIFDATVKLPSENMTYQDDYTQEGSNFLITFRKEF